jgi:hypothetical protein
MHRYLSVHADKVVGLIFLLDIHLTVKIMIEIFESKQIMKVSHSFNFLLPLMAPFSPYNKSSIR